MRLQAVDRRPEEVLQASVFLKGEVSGLPSAKKTPVGVEPTGSGFAGRRHAVWLQRRMARLPTQTGEASLLPESSHAG